MNHFLFQCQTRQIRKEGYTCEISNDAGTDICHANVKLGKAYNNNIVGIDALRILLHQQAPL